MTAVKINRIEERVLKALESGGDYGDFCFVNFKYVARRTKLSRKVIRRAARSLARKGLAEYSRGLWTEEGKVAGSGYCCTKAGQDFLRGETA